MRLFVAVWPPGEALDAIEAMPRPERAGVRWTTREQWHVTLRFLGRVDDPAPVLGALAEAALPRARGVLGPRSERLGRSVLCLPAAGLDELAAVVRAATAGVGAPEGRPFRGHLTLARSRHGGVGSLAGQPLVAEFPVEEVSLVRSHLHPDGARYETIHVHRTGA